MPLNLVAKLFYLEHYTSGLCAKLGNSSLRQNAQLSFADKDVGEERER